MTKKEYHEEAVEMIIEIFYEIDNFCNKFHSCLGKELLTTGNVKRIKKSSLCMSEIMTIVVYFHHSGYKTFKDYYSKEVITRMRHYFPRLVSYTRFVELMKSVVVPLLVYAKHCRTGKSTGVSFIDSTTVAVCHNRRIYQNKTFKGIAERGKTSMGWFYGFKLHLVVNEKGEILSFEISRGNVADCDKKIVKRLTKNIYGNLFGDKGYLSKDLFDSLYKDGIVLFTKLRKNMKNKLIRIVDKLLLRKRGLIESINDNLKNCCQIEHTRHRSPVNFLANLFSGIIAYTFLPKKPSIKIDCENLLEIVA